MIDRNSWGYATGRLLAKATLLIIGFLIGKKYTQRPIDKGYPEKPRNNGSPKSPNPKK